MGDMDVKKHIKIFDRPYPAEKQAEGLAITEAIHNGECNKCGFLSQCKSDESFVFPVFAWCSGRKSEILAEWNRRAGDE